VLVIDELLLHSISVSPATGERNGEF